MQTARVRISKPEYIACPSCGRTLYDLQETLAAIKARTAHLVGVKIGVMGCIVNGPGESRQADIGVSLPGSGESPVAPVYIRGEKAGVLKGADIAKQFQDIIEKFVRENYAKQGS